MSSILSEHKIINRSVFRDFFNNTYSKVNFEEDDFNSNVIISCVNRLLTKENLISDNRQTSTTPIQTSLKGTKPPVATNTPVVKVPPVPNKNNVTTAENKPEVKLPPIIKPEVKVPPVIKEVKKVDIPPPSKGKIPPPPPPPPPIKMK